MSRHCREASSGQRQLPLMHRTRRKVTWSYAVEGFPLEVRLDADSALRGTSLQLVPVCLRESERDRVATLRTAVRGGWSRHVSSFKILETLFGILACREAGVWNSHAWRVARCLAATSTLRLRVQVYLLSGKRWAITFRG